MKNDTKEILIALLKLMFQIARLIIVVVGLYFILFRQQELIIVEPKTNPQTEANKRWQEKNREKAKYLRNRSTARSFVKNQATKEDIAELQQLIENRIAFLNTN